MKYLVLENCNGVEKTYLRCTTRIAWSLRTRHADPPHSRPKGHFPAVCAAAMRRLLEPSSRVRSSPGRPVRWACDTSASGLAALWPEPRQHPLAQRRARLRQELGPLANAALDCTLPARFGEVKLVRGRPWGVVSP